MQCETFEGRLHELLDGRERPESDASLREHALVCGGCAEKLAAQEALFAGLARAEIPALSPDFTQRVLASRRPEARPTRFRRFTFGLLVLAALLMLAVLPTYWILIGREPAGSGSEKGDLIAEETTPTLNRDDVSTRPDGPDTGVQEERPGPNSPPLEGGSAAGTMIAGTGLPNVFRGLPSVGDLPWEVPDELPGIDRERAEVVKEVWVNQVATPLKPVTNSVNGAFNVLRRTLAAGPGWQLDSDRPDEPQARFFRAPITLLENLS